MQANPYLQQIIDTANQYGVDPNLAIGVARQESGINPNVRDSPTGAMGMFQLEPETAKGLGVNPRDVNQNIVGGIRYLRQMHDQFGGDPKLTLAAYNAGPERVKKYLNGGVPLPAETTNYIRSITGSPIDASTYQPSSGNTPMANVMQMAQQPQPPSSVLFGGNPTPIGALGGIARMLGIGSEPELGRHLQNAGAALLSVGNFGQNGASGAAALQNAANMPLFRQHFMLSRDAYGNLVPFNTHTGQVGSMPNAPSQPQGQTGDNGEQPPGAPTDVTNAYATRTPAGIKALGDEQIKQSVKDKAKLMDSAQQALQLKSLLERQMQLAQDPDVIQGAFAEPREAANDALSYITGKRYGYNTASKTDEFNTNNATLVALSKSLLGSNARIAAPEITFLQSTKPGFEKQMDANLAIYKHMSNLADRTLYAAGVAAHTPVLTNDFYNHVNDHFAKMPGYTNDQGDNPAAARTKSGNVDPNSFWKKQ